MSHDPVGWTSNLLKDRWDSRNIQVSKSSFLDFTALNCAQNAVETPMPRTALVRRQEGLAVAWVDFPYPVKTAAMVIVGVLILKNHSKSKEGILRKSIS